MSLQVSSPSLYVISALRSSYFIVISPVSRGSTFFRSIAGFFGRMNEDVNTYTRLNSLGLVCISFPFIVIHQRASQTGNGMSETYDKYGTYVKSFYSVIQNPAFTKISILQSPSSYRIHHNINHKYSDAKIISSKYKKN